MVFFTCGNCGESVKKPSIEKHYSTKCRGPPNVTCVDCLKDFKGDEYVAHIKCVTELERYSAKGFVAKASSNKGEKKQQTWCEAMQSILNDSARSLRPDERELLTVLSEQENVPRKKGKFMNFINNAHRPYARRQELVERVWNIIEEAGKAASANTNGRNQPKTDSEASSNLDEKKNVIPDGNEDVNESPKKKKKSRKSEVGDDVTINNETGTENNDDTGSAKKKKKNKVAEIIDNSENGTDNKTDAGSEKKKKNKQAEETNDSVLTPNNEETIVNGSSKKKKNKRTDEASDSILETNSEDTSKQNEKRKETETRTMATDGTNGLNDCNGVIENKKKRKAEDKAEDVGGKKAKGDIVRKIIEEAKDSISLHELHKSLTQHCASTAGIEKGEKMLKKILKSISITRIDEKFILNLE